MAKRETVFNSAWKRRLLPLVGVFPISPQRGELDEAGLRTVYQVLDRGGVVLIFPEGRYSRGQALRPLKDRKVVTIDRDNFNDVLAKATPRVAMK